MINESEYYNKQLNSDPELDQIINDNLETLKRYYLELELKDILYNNPELNSVIKDLIDVINMVNKVNNPESFWNMIENFGFDGLTKTDLEKAIIEMDGYLQ